VRVVRVERVRVEHEVKHVERVCQACVSRTRRASRIRESNVSGLFKSNL
jgi:hypothetical protein